MSVIAGGTPEKPPQSLFSRRRIRILYLTAVTVGALLLAYRVREALNPFLLSVLIAYILNPVVGALERRAGLPRTLAILLLYLGGLGIVAAGSAYSITKTLTGVDKVMVKIAGGWQIVPPGAAHEHPEGEEHRADEDPSLRPAAARPLPGLPVYADDEITQNPVSPVLGWIDFDRNGRRDVSEPEFTRESGRWTPRPEFASMVRRVPGYLDAIREELSRRAPQFERRQIEEIGDKVKTGAGFVVTAAGQVWSWVTGLFLGGLTTVALYCVLVPVYTFFLLRGFDAIVARVRGLLPGLHRDRVESIARRIDRACAAFFRGRFLICLGKGVLTWLGLHFAGVEFAFPIGMIAGALSIIPAVGPILGMALAVVGAYGPGGDWLARILWAGVVFGVVEALEAVANPVLLGREVGLHPVSLLLALFTFGDLFGFFGLLLAVPLAAIAKILAQEFVLPELEHLAAESPDGPPLSGIFPAFVEPERIAGPPAERAAGQPGAPR